MQPAFQQLVFEFATSAYEYEDENLVVSVSNQSVHRLITTWPYWASAVASIIGEKGAGKTHFAKVWQKKTKAYEFSAAQLDEAAKAAIEGHSILIENIYYERALEKGLFHLLNSIYQAKIEHKDVSLLLTSSKSISSWSVCLPDLGSRLKTMIEIYIEQPDDVLLRAVLLKLFSDKQINIDTHILNYMICRMERSLNFAIDLVNLCDKEALKDRSKINKHIVNIALNQLLAE